jgi:hypothetical protein
MLPLFQFFQLESCCQIDFFHQPLLKKIQLVDISDLRKSYLYFKFNCVNWVGVRSSNAFDKPIVFQYFQITLHSFNMETNPIGDFVAKRQPPSCCNPLALRMDTKDFHPTTWTTG